MQLLTDGEEVYARTERGEFFNLLRAPAQPLLVVGNEGLLKELSSSLRSRKKKRARKAGVSESEKSSRGRRRAGE